MDFIVEDAPPDLTIPEDHIVRAKLMEIKETEIPGRDGGKRKVLDWWWEVQTGEYKGRKVKGRTSNKLNLGESNRFKAWTEALLNRELQLGMKVGIEDLIGLQADITVRHRPDTRYENKKWEDVDEVIPVASFDDTPPF